MDRRGAASGEDRHRNGPADPFARSRGARRIAATRLLAHRLFHRACRRDERPDLATALRLADERLVPSAEARRAAAGEAHRLCRLALRRRRCGGSLEGRLETWLPAPAAESEKKRRILVPTLIHRPGGGLTALDFAPRGDRRTWLRLQDSRRAVAALFGRRAFGVLIRVPSANPPGSRRRR